MTWYKHNNCVFNRQFTTVGDRARKTENRELHEI